jgi:hypothetical protein
MQASCQWRAVLRRVSFASMLLLGCTATAFNNGVFHAGDVHFAAGPIPASWQQVEPENSDAGLESFAFRDESREITVGGTGRCNRDGDDVPLQALTQHLTIGFTERKPISEQQLTLDGRAALRTELMASLDGVPVHLVFVVIKKDRCVYDFWRIAPTTAQTTSDFDRFVSGFRSLD